METGLLWTLVVVFASVVVLLASKMWVGLAIGAVGVFLLTFVAKAPIVIGDALWNSLNSYVLAAIPFFVFMGEIILRSGLAEGLYRGVSKWTGIVRGGLTHTNIVSCALFAAISGSSVATAATIGTVAYPEQVKRGYSRRLVLGSLAAGGTLGPMIPPSIGLILYGATTSTSVGKLFMGTAIPGIIMAIVYMAYIYIRNLLDPSLGPPPEKFTWRYFPEALKSFKDIWPIALLMGIIFVGIYGGFMTPTEAAAVSSIVAICIAAIYKKLTFKLLKESSIEALKISSMIALIVMSAKLLAVSLSMLMIPNQLVAFVGSLGLHPLAVWALIIVVYIFLGCFMDAISMFYLTIAVVFPLMMTLGFDPIWFGVVLFKVLEIGLITPPVGINLFVIQGVTGESFMEVVKGSWPFFVLILLVVILLTFVPQLATWLPGTIS